MKTALTAVKLGEITSTVDYGHTASSTSAAVGPKFLRITDIQDDGVNWESVPFCECSLAEEASSKLQAGDIVFARTGATTGKSFLIRDCPERAVFASYLIRVRSKPDVCPNYLAHFFKTPEYWSQITMNARGAAQLGVNATVLKSLSVPLLPIAEQKRIAAILDKAEELRGLRRKALGELDAIVQSIFLEMFGDPVVNPKGWERKSIKQIGQVITGNTPPRAQPELYGNAIEWIKSDNINTPHHYLTKASEGLSEIGKAISRTVPPSSILVTCIAGTPDCIGNAAIADREVAFNQQINALVPVIGDFRFLYDQILVNKRLIQEASTSSMKGMVSKSRFEEIQLIFPPTNMQTNFGESFDRIEHLKATHRESLAHLDALFASLQHRAFRGEL